MNGPRSRVLGWGADTPGLVVTNEELAPIVDSSAEWIVKRSGIRERRYVDNAEGSVAMADTAARSALEMAATELGELDVIIGCTLSPDIDFPSNAQLLQERLGVPGIPAFDVRNQCSGFLYALAVADQFVRTGARRVLVVGSEVHSSGLDFQGKRGRAVTVLFGDAAGAAVLGPSDEQDRGLLAYRLHAEGEHADKLWVSGPSHRHRPRLDLSCLPPESNDPYPIMNGRYVFQHAVERMTESIRDVTAEAGLTPADIDMLLPHQANLRINQMLADTLELGEDRVANNIERYGNTTAATIPLLLTETAAAGRIKRGDAVCVTAFGAGFTWGAALYRW